ncbi:MAG: hypothetical protein SFU86_21550 [Pirellulaceae bacterium]|nr:hypothetical protein [Pirellulaceae bacterium]
MTTAPSLAKLAAWRPVETTAAEIRRECAATEYLVGELFADLDRLHDELARRADDLEAARLSLAQREVELAEQRAESGKLAHQLDQQGARLSETLAELRSLREELAHERSPLRPAPTLGAPAEGAPEISLAPLLAEFAELRRHVDETRDELGSAIHQVALAAPAENASPAISPEFTGQVVALERERAELEAELELVRTRAAELQQTVSEQRRELTQQHEELTNELKLLRDLLEQQGDLLAARGAEPHAAPAAPPMLPTMTIPAARASALAAAPADPAEADPVVNSVMAQFARLQKDVAQRRQQKKK